MTEHGGAVPGWLNDFGRNTLDRLNKFFAEFPDGDPDDAE